MVAMTDLPLPIKGHLANRGITHSELAKRLGMSRPYVCEVINRRRPVSRTFALAVAQELDLALDEVSVLLGQPSSWGRGRWPANA